LAVMAQQQKTKTKNKNKKKKIDSGELREE
jgi:hypothetical protein